MGKSHPFQNSWVRARNSGASSPRFPRRMRAPRESVAPARKLIPGDPSAPSQVTPSESLALAELIRDTPGVLLRATSARLGRRRVHVDTPDVSYHPDNGRNGWWISAK